MIITVAVSVGLASAAAADVLVNAIYPSAVNCGKPVKPGIWYQSFSGGPRWAHMTIKDHRGKIVWRKSATATTSWRYWRFYGNCGARYVLTYRTAGGTVRFHFRVRQ
jgi:hypothetical protein